MFSARISPASSVLPVDKSRQLRGIARDRSGRQVDEDLKFVWEIVEGEGGLENENGEIVTFKAPLSPGLTRVQLTVSQQGIVAQADSMITVTDSILPESKEQAAHERDYRDTRSSVRQESCGGHNTIVTRTLSLSTADIGILYLRPAPGH